MAMTTGSSLYVVPVTRDMANVFVARLHRHNAPVETPQTIYCLGVCDSTGAIRGVAIVGRPSSRNLCDDWTVEVLRTCTDGTANANSMLYGAAWRVAKGLGYRRVITYTHHSETGASLRAAGWIKASALPATPGWDRPSRIRDNSRYDSTARWRWEIRATPPPSELVVRLPDDHTGRTQDAFDFGAVS